MSGNPPSSPAVATAEPEQQPSPGAGFGPGIPNESGYERYRMSIAEFRNIRLIFKEFDEDGSGTIDRQELRKVMHSMGHLMTDQQLEELLKQVDVNETGDLDFDEFVQLINLWKEAQQFKLFDGQGPPSIQERRIEEALSSQFWLPDSVGRAIWDLTILLILLYFWITTLLVWTFPQEDVNEVTEYLRATDIIFSIGQLIDVGVNFITCVRCKDEKGKHYLLDDVKSIGINYLTGWFAIDLLACVPFNQINGESIVFRILSLLRLLKNIKQPFLFAYSGNRHATPQYVYFFHYLLPMLKLLVSFFMFVHFCAVIWTIAKVFFPMSRKDPTTIASNDKTLVDLDTSYTTALYFVMTTLTTTGYGDVAVIGVLQQGIAIALCLCGTVLNGLIIGLIVNILQSTDIQTDRKNKLRETLAVCQYFHIPEGLQEEILQFQNHVLEHNLSTAYTDLVSFLPTEMQKNINLYVRIRLVSYVPFFEKAHQGAKVAIAQELAPTVFRPEEYIVIAGDSGDAMYFISYGFVDVVRPDGMRMTTLKQGDYFGEMALLTIGCTRSATVIALSYCDLFCLKRLPFMSILKRFPRFRVEIMDAAEQRRVSLLAALGDLAPAYLSLPAEAHFKELQEEVGSPTTSVNSALLHCIRRVDELEHLFLPKPPQEQKEEEGLDEEVVVGVRNRLRPTTLRSPAAEDGNIVGLKIANHEEDEINSPKEE